MISMDLKHRQRGMALLVSLVFLLLLTLIGLSSMQSATLQEKMTSSVMQRNQSFQIAEAALRMGESAVQVETYSLPACTTTIHARRRPSRRPSRRRGAIRRRGCSGLPLPAGFMACRTSALRLRRSTCRSIPRRRCTGSRRWRWWAITSAAWWRASMRNTEARRGWIAMLWGLLLSLYLAAPAYAFTPSDSPLLSAAAVTPNVMLLIDDSGSMNNIIWAAGFDPAAAQTRTYACSASNNCNDRYELDLEDSNILLVGLLRGGCSSGWYGLYRPSIGRVCLRLPDPVGGGNTRYTGKYLAYLVTLANGSSRDFTTGTIPNDYRINVARDVSNDLVASNRALRIGLATFNPPNSSNSGPGGYIARAISDLSPVSGSVTQTQANSNYSALINAINGLGAVANTPLAESYYEVTRYFRGMAPYYNSTPTTYTSPIQYRCQKNFGVVITDGLPTYDRTFPTNDPLGLARLPNWDGVNNDGADLSGDGEGDTLYLDDIAKFAFDIDMRSTGTDATGQSWNATDFTRQYLNTYTVGFTASNPMLSDAARYGAGKYYQASDSEGLNSALASALSDITSKAGSGGAGTTNAATLSSTSSYYQTTYDPKDWRGTIRAFGFTSAGTVNRAAVQWTTDTAIVPGATAPIYQSWNTVTNVPVTLAFANFSPAQQTSLSQNLPTGITGNDLVEWSKGVNKTGLKVRSVLLGDIINSPLVLASPNEQTAADLLNDTSYSTYLTTKAANMSANLVVNANDGFFSVINSTNGTRRYAYMPSSVLPSLQNIADTNYVNGVSHKFLVDGQIGVFDTQSGECLEDGGRGRHGCRRQDVLRGPAVRCVGGQCVSGVVGNQRADRCQHRQCFQ